jgi:hypothetical protein
MGHKYIKVDGVFEIPEEMSVENLIYLVCNSVEHYNVYVGANWEDITEQIIEGE